MTKLWDRGVASWVIRFAGAEWFIVSLASATARAGSSVVVDR